MGAKRLGSGPDKVASEIEPCDCGLLRDLELWIRSANIDDDEELDRKAPKAAAPRGVIGGPSERGVK